MDTRDVYGAWRGSDHRLGRNVAEQTHNARYGQVLNRAVSRIVSSVSIAVEPISIFCEITRITWETSKPAEWLAASRPFRRIVIYGKRLHEDVFIDVSLKHFAADDVRELMRVVRGRRPDLTLPKHWL